MPRCVRAAQAMSQASSDARPVTSPSSSHAAAAQQPSSSRGSFSQRKPGLRNRIRIHVPDFLFSVTPSHERGGGGGESHTLPDDTRHNHHHHHHPTASSPVHRHRPPKNARSCSPPGKYCYSTCPPPALGRAVLNNYRTGVRHPFPRTFCRQRHRGLCLSPPPAPL